METDPFKHGRKPIPFAFGFFDGVTFHHTWGKRCIDEMWSYIYELEPGIIYIHNGGKFDDYYLMDWFTSERDLTIINGRIVKGYIKCRAGFHEIRDSYALMPFPLSKYKKDEISYDIFERDMRNKPENKSKIVSYLKGDCVYLHELCASFVNTFGNHLTIGGTSMCEFKKLHQFERMNDEQDKYIRDRYYYGGRVQCFEKGMIETHRKDVLKVYDINQSYPNAMRNFLHPVSAGGGLGTTITDQTYFVGCRGWSTGCFPRRNKLGIEFPEVYGDFFVTIHEYHVAVELGLFETDEILETVNYTQASSFETFVDTFHTRRKDAQLRGDAIGSLFYKYVGNSCYGKFAQSPENYFDYRITDSHVDLTAQGYERDSLQEFTGYILWKIPSQIETRYNVATGASITGAARSVLMRGLAHSKRPIYCDTDSIICEDLAGELISETKLGAWKIEKYGDKLAVAGKKMYALFDGDECVKMASKGVRLTPQEIVDVCNGKEIHFLKDSPTYRFDGSEPRYLERTVRMT